VASGQWRAQRTLAAPALRSVWTFTDGSAFAVGGRGAVLSRTTSK
jgi:hypothetical protein